MPIFIIIPLIFAFTAIIIAWWVHFRSKRVLAFLQALVELIQMHLEANRDYYASHPAVIDIPIPGFFRITFSIKKLTLENWISKENIELLYNYDLAKEINPDNCQKGDLVYVYVPALSHDAQRLYIKNIEGEWAIFEEQYGKIQLKHCYKSNPKK